MSRKKGGILTLQFISDFLSKLAENSNSVYWLSSPDFKRIAYISPAYEKIWGRSREILYKKPEIWATYLFPGDLENYHPIEAMAERVAKLGPAARFDERYRIVRPDGEVRWIIDRGFPVYDEMGQCCGVTGVAVDITQEKLAEEALRKAKEEAELANRLKLDFICNMQHDIRTPFYGLNSIAESLAKKEKEPKKKELLDMVVHCSKELLDFCNYILDFSKTEMGVFPVLSKKFDLKRLVQSVITIEAVPAMQKKLELKLIYEKNLPPVVIGDQHRLQRILINLISNAIKFTNKGHVKLSVKLAKHIKKNRIAILQFVVSDTGIGIPKEKQDIIYEKFSRVSPTNKSLYQGQGLGLYVVKQFVDELDGEIEVRSTGRKGTTFICTLSFKLPLI